MKIIVFSDSHGRLGAMLDAVEREKPDHLFFLGDCLEDCRALERVYPDLPVSAVRGNCDYGPGEDKLLVDLGGARFFLTHGHDYGVRIGLGRLARAAKQAGACMACFGHTHHGVNKLSGEGVWLFNPGTAGGVRERESYGLLTVEQGKVTGDLK